MTRSIVDAHAHVWNRARTPIDWIDESLPDIDRDFAVAELEQTGRDAAHALGVELEGFVLVQSLNDPAETADLLRTAPGPVVGWLDLDTPPVPTAPDVPRGAGRAVTAGAAAAAASATGEPSSRAQTAPDAGLPGSADVADRLAALRAGPHGHRLVGIRHLAHIDPDPEWLLRPGVARGLAALAAADLSFDLVVRPWQLPLAARVADAHPTLRLVLDHLGQPPAALDPAASPPFHKSGADFGEPGANRAARAVAGNEARRSPQGSGPNRAASDDFARWRHDLSELARRPNVVAKISGVALRGESAASGSRLDRVLGTALDAFGPSRLMFGSDWPLVRLADDYPSWLATYLAWSSPLSPTEQHALDSATARTAYGPAAPTSPSAGAPA